MERRRPLRVGIVHGLHGLGHMLRKTDLEHLVRLVKDDGLEIPPRCGLPLEMLDQSPERGDDDDSIPAVALGMTAKVNAVVQEDPRQPAARAVDELLHDLRCELARRREAEDRLAELWPVGLESLHQRQHEREHLPAAISALPKISRSEQIEEYPRPRSGGELCSGACGASPARPPRRAASC